LAAEEVHNPQDHKERNQKKNQGNETSPFFRYSRQPEMFQKGLRTEQQDAGNCLNCAQDKECYEVSEESEDGRRGIVWHNTGQNSMGIGA
jgi:hypothetical protein